MAGNTGTAARTVNVLPNRATFSFSDKGKEGNSFTHSFTAAFPSTATITATGVDGKTQATVSIKDVAGNTVFSGAFNSAAAKTAQLPAGSLTLTIKIDSANGNVSVGANLSLVEVEPLQLPMAPTVKLIGSAQIVLHLGGSPYVEQGVIATDPVDSATSLKTVTESNVDTSRAGNYNVKYTVTNSKGLSSSVTRQVSLIAPQTRAIPARSYAFAPKDKQGATFTYSADVDVATSMSLTVSVPNKTTTTVKVTDSAGNAVFQETFTATAARSFPVKPGKHTVSVSIDVANGNTTINVGLAIPQGTEQYFPLPETTL